MIENRIIRSSSFGDGTVFTSGGKPVSFDNVDTVVILKNFCPSERQMLRRENLSRCFIVLDMPIVSSSDLRHFRGTKRQHDPFDLKEQEDRT